MLLDNGPMFVLGGGGGYVGGALAPAQEGLVRLHLHAADVDYSIFI